MTAKITFFNNNKNKIIKGVIFDKNVKLVGDTLEYPVVSVKVYSGVLVVEDINEKKIYEKLKFFEALNLYKKLVTKHDKLKGAEK